MQHFVARKEAVVFHGFVLGLSFHCDPFFPLLVDFIMAPSGGKDKVEKPRCKRASSRVKTVFISFFLFLSLVFRNFHDIFKVFSKVFS
jgi:hypothetical protein